MVFEDIDRAPLEILSALVPLLEDRKLYLAGRGEVSFMTLLSYLGLSNEQMLCAYLVYLYTSVILGVATTAVKFLFGTPCHTILAVLYF